VVPLHLLVTLLVGWLQHEQHQVKQDEAFMLQVARHLTNAADGVLDGPGS
jgi:hypothetical protein